MAFLYFNFERNCDVLKLKNPGILLSKDTNFNNNETESKMENPTHSFRETNLVLQHIKESLIKRKTVTNWNSRKRRKRVFFVPFILSEGNFETFAFYLSV